jgi:hypothetical protein
VRRMLLRIREHGCWRELQSRCENQQKKPSAAKNRLQVKRIRHG